MIREQNIKRVELTVCESDPGWTGYNVVIGAILMIIGTMLETWLLVALGLGIVFIPAFRSKPKKGKLVFSFEYETLTIQLPNHERQICLLDEVEWLSVTLDDFRGKQNLLVSSSDYSSARSVNYSAGYKNYISFKANDQEYHLNLYISSRRKLRKMEAFFKAILANDWR